MPTPEQRLRDLYGVAFPDSFFAFRDFLTRLAPNLLADACDMRPCYPFEAADGKPARDFPERPRWEDRYYHDLPEFVTIFRGSVGGLHWGYFFDAPGARDPVVARYWAHDTFEHTCDGDDIFEAVRWRVEQSEGDFLEMMEDEPEERDHYRLRLEQVAAVREELSYYWGKDRPETGDEYADAYGETRSDIADDTWDRMGIIVPDGLYRPLSVDLADRGSGTLADVQPSQVEQLTAEAMQLLRDGFPGAALKLGRDLWVLGDTYPQGDELLDAAYAALGREPLRAALVEARALQAHYHPRRK